MELMFKLLAIYIQELIKLLIGLKFWLAKMLGGLAKIGPRFGVRVSCSLTITN